MNAQKNVNNLQSIPKKGDYLPPYPIRARQIQPSELGKIHAALWKLGADLTYIEWLSEELELGDVCFNLLKSEIILPGVIVGGPNPFDELDRRFPPGTRDSDEFQAAVRNLFARFQIHLPLSGSKLSRKLHEKLALQKQLEREKELPHSLIPLNSGCGSFEAAIDEKWSWDTLFSFLETVAAVHYRDGVTKPSDRWGSFFMLAVCTHLRKDANAKQHQEHQLQAIRLLRAIRRKKFKSDAADRKDANNRLCQLRKYHRGLVFLLEETRERYYAEKTERNWIKDRLKNRGPDRWGLSCWIADEEATGVLRQSRWFGPYTPSWQETFDYDGPIQTV